LKKAIFEGLVFDEHSQPLNVVWVGDEPCYVINDDGFLRHIPAGEIDRSVWDFLRQGLEGNEDFLSQKAAEMMGQDDPFTIAVIRSHLERSEEQFAQLQEVGIPENDRLYMGMAGFRVIVNYRGELVEVKQPTITTDDYEE